MLFRSIERGILNRVYGDDQLGNGEPTAEPLIVYATRIWAEMVEEEVETRPLLDPPNRPSASTSSTDTTPLQPQYGNTSRMTIRPVLRSTRRMRMDPCGVLPCSGPHGSEWVGSLLARPPNGVASARAHISCVELRRSERMASFATGWLSLIAAAGRAGERGVCQHNILGLEVAVADALPMAVLDAWHASIEPRIRAAQPRALRAGRAPASQP